jgi:hypothetical protein
LPKGFVPNTVDGIASKPNRPSKKYAPTLGFAALAASRVTQAKKLNRALFDGKHHI